MALYSWFLRTKTKPKITRENKELLNASKSVKYIENYTMWPTAKIKEDVEIIPPSYNDLDNETLNDKKPILANSTILAVTVIKN